MNAQRIVIAAALSAAGAGLLWLAKAGSTAADPLVVPAGIASEDGPATSGGASLESLGRVGGLSVAERENATDAGAGLDPSGVEPPAGQDASVRGGWRLPRRLRWIDSRSGEPRAYEWFVIKDVAGETFTGESDMEGWADVPLGLTPGPVDVHLLRGSVRPETLFGFGDAEGKLDGLVLAAGVGSGAADECIWTVSLARYVPIRFRVEPALAMVDRSKIEAWLTCAGTADPLQQTFVKYDVKRQMGWHGERAAKFRHATHALRLPKSADEIRRHLSVGAQRAQWHPPCWLQEAAGERLANRRALFVLVDGGTIYASDTKETILPRVGERPLEITLREQPGQLAHPVLDSIYRVEARLQQDEIDRVESEKARPVFQVTGSLRSNSGRYQGQVAIRANPAERNEEGGYDLRQQWITAEWQEVAPGHFEAPFTLDRLDAGPYTVLFLPQDGTAVSQKRVALDTTTESPGTLVVTVLD